MVKHQIHEDFKVFVGASILELSKAVADWVAQNRVAAKSLSVLREDTRYIVVLGFNEGEMPYPVAIEAVPVTLPHPNLQGIEEAIEDAVSDMSGSVICHSLFVDETGMWSVAFLLHE
jgi:hypothetical protein